MTEQEKFTSGRIPMGTATLNDHGEVLSARQAMFLDLIEDGVARGEIGGTLLVERRHSSSTYLAIEVLPFEPKFAERIRIIKSQYASAISRWVEEGFPKQKDIESFRERYLKKE